jgi:hypothetical protein
MPEAEEPSIERTGEEVQTHPEQRRRNLTEREGDPSRIFTLL